MDKTIGLLPGSSGELPPPGVGPPKERTDAARNRARILAAAGKLFAEHGVGGVSMDEIAAAAGVGKGTLFRRFGDKAGLAVALLDSAERELQQAVLYGPAPLGPGADPAIRLITFVAAYADFLDEQLSLLHMSETARAGARYRVGAYRFWHRHAAILLAQARPDLDAEYLAHALLAPLAAEQRQGLRDEVSAERLKEGVVTLARLVLSGAASGG